MAWYRRHNLVDISQHGGVLKDDILCTDCIQKGSSQLIRFEKGIAVDLILLLFS